MAELLIAHGADVDMRSRHRRTPLHLAARAGRKRMIEFLLSVGANVNALDRHGRTPLDEAAINGHKKAGQILLDSEGQMHSPASRFFIAATSCDTATCAELLRNHHRLVHERDRHGETALFKAVRGDCLELAGLLLSHGASVNVQSNPWDLNAPLTIAAARGDRQMVELLIDHGAQIVRRKRHGYSRAMFHATRGGFNDILLIMLERGAEANTRVGLRATSLHTAAECANIDAARMLLERGAVVDGRDFFGRTPLYYAASGGHVEIASMLIDAGANVNARCGDHSVLLGAVSNGHLAMVRLLIRHGAKVNVRARYGITLLHVAASFDRAEVAEELINAGARLNARTREECDTCGWQNVPPGTTPLGLALIAGAHEAAEVLKRHGAKT